MDELEKFISAENIPHKSAVLLKKFIVEYTPHQVDVFLHEFLSDLKNDNRSNSTIKNYRSDIQQLITLTNCKKISNLFNPENLRNFVHEQLSNNLKVSTIKRKLTSISQFAIWAEDKELVKDASFWISDIDSLIAGKAVTKKLDSEKPQKKSNFGRTSDLNHKSVSVLLEEYLMTLEIDNHSPATIKNYKSDISQFIDFSDTSTIHQLISESEIEKFVISQRKAGLKVSSIKRKITSISQFALWAEKRDEIQGASIWIHHLPNKFFEQKTVTTKTNKELSQDNNQKHTSKSAKNNLEKTTHTREKGFELKLKNHELVKAHSAHHAESRGWKLPTPGFASLKSHSTKVTHSGNHQGKNQNSNSDTSNQDAFSGIRDNLNKFADQINTKRNKKLLPYFNLVMIFLFVIGLGFLAYQQFITQAPTPLAYPSSPVRPNRELSFQGRLTDTAQNPVTTSTGMAFRLYDNNTGGTQLWSSGSCSVTPDQDGIFNVGLGDDCGSEISQDVFTENSNVWLEVEIDSETLAPRQSIKTVAYAINSETVQGYPVSATGAATTNTILTMDAGGQVLLGEVSPTLKATNGTFSIEAQAINIQTSTGSNGDINLIPDGTGTVIVQSDLDLEGYLHAPGATFSATYAGGTALIAKGGPTGTANIQEWQNNAGTALSVVDENGNIGIGTNNPVRILHVEGSGNGTSIPYFRGKANYTGDSTPFEVFNFTRTDDSMPVILSYNGVGELGLSGGLVIGSSWPGINTAGNGLIVQHNIGIGTTTAAYQLDVVGEANFTDAIRAGGDAGTAGYLLTSSAGGVNTWTDPASLIGSTIWTNTANVIHPSNEYAGVADLTLGGNSTASANIHLQSNGQAYFGGNVGVGTSNPTQKFQVTGGAIKLDNNQSIMWRNAANNADVPLLTLNTSNIFNIGSTSSSTPAQIALHTASSERMRIDASGNLGVGTTTPIGKLNVEGSVKGKALTILNETGDQDILAASVSGVTKFRLANTGYLYAERFVDNSNSNYYLDPANTGNSLTTAGNVGVGTDSPTALFQISDRWQGTTSTFGSTNASGAQLQYTGGITTPIFTFNGDTDTGIGRGGSNILNFMTGGSERMRIATDGNVGIGTTNPDTELNLASGSIKIGTSDCNNSLCIDGSGIDTGWNYTITNHNGGSLLLMPDGNVGIGSTSPAYKLDLVGEFNLTDAIRVAGDAGTSGFFLTSSAGGANTWTDPASITGAGYWAETAGVLHPKSPYTDVVDLALGGNSTASANIHLRSDGQATFAGNIGIGTTSPNAPIDIQKSIQAGPVFRFDGIATDGSTDNTDGVGMYLTHNGAGNRQFVIARTDDIVGVRFIGTTIDGYNSGSRADLTLGTETNGAHVNYAVSNSQFSVSNRSGTVSKTVLAVEGDTSQTGALLTVNNYGGTLGDKFIVKADGNVGIGSTSPAYKLDLVGEFNLTDAIRVAGDAGTTGYFLTSSAGGANTWTDPASITSAGWWDNTANVLHAKNEYASVVDLALGGNSTSSANIHLKSDGNAYFAGNVGINTTTPSSTFTVAVGGALQTTSGLAIGGATSTGTNTITSASTLVLQPQATSLVRTGWGQRFEVPDGAGSAGAKIDGSGDSYFYGGNLGVGTYTPARLFEVKGISGTNGYLRLNTADADNPTSATHLEFAEADVVKWDLKNIGNNADRLILDSATTSNVMVFNQDGNVGIGSSIPAYLLDVNGDVQIGDGTANALLKFDAGTSGTINVNENDVARFYDNGFSLGSTYYAVTAPSSGAIIEGNVGIGTSAPVAQLNVEQGDASNILKLMRTGSGGVRYQVSNGAYGGANMRLHLTDGLDTWSIETDSSGTPIFIADATNNQVGIGTTNPGYLLDVNGEANFTDAIRAGGDAGTAGYVLTSSAGGVNTWTNPSVLGANLWQNSNNVFHPSNELAEVVDLAIGGTSTASADIQLLSNGSAVFNQQGNDADFRVEATGQANALFVQGSDGNVGIGSATPGKTLDVTGTGRFSGALTLNGVAAGTDNTVLVLNSSNEVVQDEIDSRVWGTSLVDGSGTLNYLTKWSPDGDSIANSQVFDDGTNVGIGTTTPDSKLEISSTTNPQLKLTHTAGIDEATIGVDSNGILGIVPTGGLYLFADPGQASRSILAGERTINSSSSVYGYNLDLHKTGSGGAAGINAFTYADASGASSTLEGAYLQTEITGAYTMSSQNGLRSVINNNASAIVTNNLDGVQSRLHAVGTVSGNTNFFHANNTLSGGTIGNLSGLYVDELTQGTNNYAVYTDGATQSYFGGNVGIGSTTPGYKLDVQDGTGIVGRFSGRVIGADAVNTNEFVTRGQLGTLGVTSVTGTANQITATPTTGDVVLSIPSDFRAPGTVNAVSGLYTGAGAGTQRVDASGNLVNIGNVTAVGTNDSDNFKFTGYSTTTGERDTFTITDPSNGTGLQDESSVLKVIKTGDLDTAQDGASLLELTYSGTAAQTDKQFYAVGRRVDEGAVKWGISLIDADFWTEGSVRGGATGTDCAGTGAACFNSASFQLAASGDSYINGGNLGIGTATPSYQFETTNDVRLAASDFTVSDGRGFTFTEDDFYHYYGSGTGIETNPRFGYDRAINPGGGVSGSLIFNQGGGTSVNAGGATINQPAVRTLAFSTSTGATLAERMRLDGNGNLGIGTTTPTGLLNVEGAVKGKALTILNETGDQDILAASASGITRFRLANTGYLYAERFVDNSNSSYYLDPANSGTSLTTAGNVGIGSTNPGATLDVVGSVNLNATTITLNDSNLTSAITLTQADSDFDSGDTGIVDAINTAYQAATGGSGSIWNDGGTFIYPSSGEVLGNSASAGANKIAGLYLSDSAPVVFGSDNDVTYNFSGSVLGVTTGNNDINFDANTLFIDGSANNVGVGTNAPQQKLEVQGTTISGDNSATAGSLGFGIRYTGANIVNTFGSSYSTPNTVIGYAVKPKSGATGYVSSAGNAAFTKGAISIGDTFEFLNAASSTVAIDSDVSMTSRFKILANGNVGVGTATPGYRLHVAGGDIGIDQPYAIKFQNAQDIRDNGSGGLHIQSIYDLDLQSGANGTGEIAFYTGSDTDLTNKRMVIDIAGNVGIGSTSPGAKLDVTGSVNFNATTITLNDSNLTSAITLTDADTDFDSGDTGIVDAINAAYNAGTSGASLFTDGGTLTYLTQTSDDFAIGGTGLASSFSVDVSTNTVRIGSATASDGSLNMYANNGENGTITYNTADQWDFTNGDIDINQYAAIGPNAGEPGTNAALKVGRAHNTDEATYQIYGANTITSPTLTADAASYGVYMNLANNKTENIGSGFDSDAYGYYALTYTTGTNTFRQNLGGYFAARNDSTAASDLGTLTGVYGYAHQNASSGTVPAAYGLYGFTQGDTTAASTSTMTAAYGNYNAVYQYNSSSSNSYGNFNRVRTNNGYDGDITNAYGTYNEVYVGSATGGDITNARAGYFYTNKLAGANNIGTAYGILIDTNAADTSYGISLAADDTDAQYNYGLVLTAQGASVGNYGIIGNEGDWLLDADGDGLAGGTGAGGDLFLGEGQDLELYHDGTNSYVVNNTGDLHINSSTNNIYLAEGGGNVGVGTTTAPSARLHVYDDRDITANLNTKGIRLSESTGDYLLSLGVSGVDNTSFAIRDVANSAYRYVLTALGNTGIGGVLTPTGALQVTGDEVRIGNAGTPNLATADGDLFVEDALEVDGIGTFGSNVGIGTTVPYSALDVQGQITGGFGAQAVGGTTDWDHVSNARSGNGYTLLQGTATNGPINAGGNYFHPFNFEYNTKNGTGNMTQLAVPYGIGGSIDQGMYMRGRYSGSWTSWVRMISEDTNGNVGIGNAAPDVFKLEVTGDVGPSTDNSFDLGSPSRRWANIYATDLIASGLWDADTDTGVQVEETADEDKIRFDTAGTERMIIDNAGLIGIGTTTPVSLLDVEGAVKGKALIQLQEMGDQDILVASNSAGTTRFRMANTGYMYAEQFVDISNSNYYVDPASSVTSAILGSNVGIGTTNPTGARLKVQNAGTEDILNLNDGSTEVFTVLDGGNVGIGSTDPIAELDISKNDGTHSSIALGVSNTARGALIQKDSTGTPYDLDFFWGRHATVESGDLNFHASQDSGAFVTFQDTGNVGINSTTPGAKLDIAAGASTSGINVSSSTGGNSHIAYNGISNYLSHSSTTGQTIIRAFTPSPLAYSTQFVVDGASGNVGIGAISSPTQKLDINAGNIQLDSTYGVYIGGSSLGEDATRLYTGTNRLLVRSEDVDGVAQFASYGLYLPLSGQTYNLYTGGSIKVGHVEHATLDINTTVRLNSNGDSYLNGGNVGIGTTSPGAYQLRVEGNQIINGNFYRTAHNNGFLVGGYNNIGANSTNTNPIYTIGSSYIPASTTLGNMYGIGYTHNGSSFINDSGTNGWGMYVAAQGAANIWFGAQANGDSYFNTGGNVGIGTNNPDYSLQVNGDMMLGSGTSAVLNFDTNNDSIFYDRSNNQFNFRIGNLTYVNWNNAFFNYGYGDSVFQGYQGGGVDVGSTRYTTNAAMDGLNIHDVNDGGTYTNIQLAERAWGASQGLLMNAYKRSDVVNGDLSLNTRYANAAGAYGNGAGLLQFAGNGGRWQFYVSPISTGKGAIVNYGTPGLEIDREGRVYGLQTWGLTARTQGLVLLAEGAVQMNAAAQVTFTNTVIIMNPLAGSWVRSSSGTYNLGSWGSLWHYIPPSIATSTSTAPTVQAWVNNNRDYDHVDRIVMCQTTGAGDVHCRNFGEKDGGGTIDADLAEYFYSDEAVVPGEVLVIKAEMDENHYSATVGTTSEENDQAIMGIISTEPGFTMNQKHKADPGYYQVALQGQVPIIVDDRNGNMKPGDIITSGTINGAGTKADKAGATVGKALSYFNPAEMTCTNVTSYEDIVWPADDPENKIQTCFTLPDGTHIGKVMAFVNISWYDPDVYLENTDDFVFETDVNGDVILTNQETGDKVTRIGAFGELLMAKFQAGTGYIQDLSVDSLKIQGMTLAEYIQSVTSGQISPDGTALLSPVDNDTIIRAASDSGQIAFENSDAQKIATISAQGDLSILGDILSDSVSASGSSTLGNLLVTKDATISGNLKAKNASVSGTLRTSSLLTGILNTDVATASSVTTKNLSVTGDASVSGTLNAGTLLTGQINAASSRIALLEAGMAELEHVKATTADITTATVSGTLYADNIYDFENKVSNTLKKPGLLDTLLGTNESTTSATLMEELYDTVNKSDFNATSSAELDLSFSELSMTSDDVTLTGTSLFIEKYFKVNGAGFISDSLAIGNDLFVGETMQIADGLIQYTTADPTNQILKIQPEGKGSIQLLAGIVTIDESGVVTVNGDLNVTGNTKVAGSLLTDLLQPTDFGNPLQVQVAGVDTQTQEVKKSRFEIINEVGTPVATFSAEGNAKFAGKVDIAGGIGLDSENLGSNENNELSTTKTSGRATIKSGANQVTIKSELMTNDTLVYVTAVGSTGNQVIYVKSQAIDDPNTPEKEGAFVVGFDNDTTTDVSFNWWIVQ